MTRFATPLPTARARLALELAFARHGWRLLAALAATAALIAVALWLPFQFARLEAANAAFARDAAQAAPRLAAALPPLDAFRGVLALQDATPTQLRVIHQKASEQGLAPGQLDLRRQHDGIGVFSQLQVTMPLRGNYLALRRFCGDVLATMPSVSIDQLVIRRDEAHPGQIEAQLALSIWQQAEQGAGGPP